MLPSSGAWQLSTNDPSDVRALSADTAAMAVGTEPHAAELRRHVRQPEAPLLGLLAQLEDGDDELAAAFGVVRSMVRSPSAGFTTVVMNSRTRSADVLDVGRET